MKTKFALVLSGGGFNGAFQLGAIHYLNENWRAITGQQSPMKFDVISGVSAGALNGAFLAMNELSKLHDLWVNRIGKNGESEIYTSPFLKSEKGKLQLSFDFKQLAAKVLKQVNREFDTIDKIGLLFSESKRKEVFERVSQYVKILVTDPLSQMQAIASNDPLKEKLLKYLDRSKMTKTLFTCGFVSLNTGRYHSVAQHEFSSNTDFCNGVLASTAIPLVWKPVDKISFETEGRTESSFCNVDGGVLNVSPLGDVIKRINEDRENCKYKIFVLNCHNPNPAFEDHSFSSVGRILARSFYELTMGEIFRNDIEHFLQVNELVKQAAKADPPLVLKTPAGRPIKEFETVIINPERAKELGNPLVANDKLISQRMAQGYQAAKRAILF